MSLVSLFQDYLPISRTEVYYTATVLPCIVCADGFAHIHRLWPLLGIEAPTVSAVPESANIQFFTEYSASKSVHSKMDKARFLGGGMRMSGETPDVLILVNGLQPFIVGIEAKMYDTVSVGDLRNQLWRQREKVLTPLVDAMPGTRLFQVALLPAGMAIAAETLEPAKLLHWQQLRAAFADIGSASYFLGVLDMALERYEYLRNEKLVFGANKEATMTGDEILRRHAAGTLDFRTMGRSGGRNGALLADDLNTGRWRKQLYELSRREELLPNWFTIEDFVATLRQSNLFD